MTLKVIKHIKYNTVIAITSLENHPLLQKSGFFIEKEINLLNLTCGIRFRLNLNNVTSTTLYN